MRIHVGIVSVVFFLSLLSPALSQERYESAPVLSASRILPPALLSGPNHRVQERVTSDGIVNILQDRFAVRHV